MLNTVSFTPNVFNISLLQIDKAGRLVDENEDIVEMDDEALDRYDEVKDLYKDRAEHAGKVCKENQEEISERYEKVWPNENYQTVMAKASLFINRDAGFLWCRVPKAASESLTLVFLNKW
jgi:hypothetical protein